MAMRGVLGLAVLGLLSLAACTRSDPPREQPAAERPTFPSYERYACESNDDCEVTYLEVEGSACCEHPCRPHAISKMWKIDAATFCESRRDGGACRVDACQRKPVGTVCMPLGAVPGVTKPTMYCQLAL